MRLVRAESGKGQRNRGSGVPFTSCCAGGGGRQDAGWLEFSHGVHADIRGEALPACVPSGQARFTIR
ncbi:hypothetical protein C7453_101618 [Gluconacetobacter liquefaciens]|uniref:Uncharacterized protein n=1 Tax=Gluconacetobacter liquefaciens TaxID=89584 RepID=A0A370GCM0_GLULI|nr:hypothetical protein C7453_101618 [Gluconacetobacter liquefaciens]